MAVDVFLVAAASRDAQEGPPSQGGNLATMLSSRGAQHGILPHCRLCQIFTLWSPSAGSIPLGFYRSPSRWSLAECRFVHRPRPPLS